MHFMVLFAPHLEKGEAMTEGEKKVLEDRVRDLEIQYATIQGERRTIITLGGTLVSVVLGFLGYQSSLGIPDLVSNKVDLAVNKEVPEKVGAKTDEVIEDFKKDAAEKFDAEARELRKSVSRGFDKELKNYSDIAEVRTKALESDNKTTLKKLFTQYAEKIKLEGESTNKQNLPDTTSKLEEVNNNIEELLKFSSEPTLLYQTVYAKSNYFLPLLYGDKLEVIKPSESSCLVVLYNEAGRQERQELVLVIGKSEEVVGTTSKYKIILEKIGSAGLNPFTKACFFTVTSTPVMESED